MSAVKLRRLYFCDFLLAWYYYIQFNNISLELRQGKVGYFWEMESRFYSSYFNTENKNIQKVYNFQTPFIVFSL